MRANQVASDLFDEAVAEYLGINRTDHRVLDVLDQHGPLSAGRLAELNRLSPAAMTTVLDRLERNGYARRFADPGDRRRILVEATPLVQRRAAKVYGPLGQAATEIAERYSAAELEVVADFFRRANELSARQLERVSRLRDGARRAAGSARP